MKEKRNYERPSMKVFELKHRPQLLVGSNLGKSSSAGVTDYTWQDVTEE